MSLVSEHSATEDTAGGLEGLRHVTAIANDPQENINFYTGVLGVCLIKLTVNFDDPTTYHLYYGCAAGIDIRRHWHQSVPGTQRRTLLGSIGNGYRSKKYGTKELP